MLLKCIMCSKIQECGQFEQGKINGSHTLTYEVHLIRSTNGFLDLFMHLGEGLFKNLKFSSFFL